MLIDRCKPLFALLALLIGTNAVADSDSFLGAAGYPATTCRKPLKPFLPVQLESSNEARIYQMNVERYNKDSQAYASCVNAYLATATADVARIQVQMDAAVAEANAP